MEAIPTRVEAIPTKLLTSNKKLVELIPSSALGSCLHRPTICDLVGGTEVLESSPVSPAEDAVHVILKFAVPLVRSLTQR